MDDENPYAAPQAELDESDFVLEGDPSIVRKGQKLVVPEGALLPTRCVKCNRPAHKHAVVAISSGLTPPQTGVFLLTLISGVLLLFFFVYHDVSLLWLIPPLGVGIATVVYLQRNAPRPIKTTFYACSKHHLLNRFGSMLWPLFMLPMIAGRFLDFDFSDYYGVPYIIVLVVLVSLSARLGFGVSGKRIEPSASEFHGFGKDYFESFPDSDDT